MQYWILLLIIQLFWLTLQTVSQAEDVCEVDPEEKSVTKPLRDFTPEQLTEFNGLACKSLYFALNGIVYDVTAHRPDLLQHSDHNLFAGKDITDSVPGLLIDHMKKLVFEAPSGRLSANAVVGMLSMPMAFRAFTVEELSFQLFCFYTVA